jgi:Na+/melibiose symporter-like transporter
MVHYWQTVRGLSTGVRYYILAQAAVGLAYFGLATVLYNLFLLRLGFSPVIIGQVNGAGQLAWALGALPSSILGRRLGYRLMNVIGCLVIALGYVLFLNIQLVPASGQVGWLFGTNILIWSGAALASVNGLPLLASVSSPEERTHAFATANATAALFAILGSLAAGFLPGWLAGQTGSSLEQAFPYQMAFWVAPIAFVLMAFTYSRIKPRLGAAAQAEAEEHSPLPLWIFLFFGVVVFFQTASEGGLRAFFNVYLDTELRLPTAQIGAMFALGGVLPILGALVMPVVVGRFGLVRALAMTAVVMAAGLIFMGRFPVPLAAAAGFSGVNFLTALAGSIRGILSQEIVAPRWRGMSSAILILGLALGWSGMAFVGSAVIEQLRFAGLMYLSAISALVSGVLLVGYLLLQRGKGKN